jgi:hypothetical protein
MKHFDAKLIYRMSLYALVLSLAACGGGGGGDSAVRAPAVGQSEPGAQSAPPPQSSIVGTVLPSTYTAHATE